MGIIADKQKLTPGRRIELFDFDATKLGGALFHFVSGFQETQPLNWKGNAYTPIPIEASGFEMAGKGTLPTPVLRISNVLLLPSAVINDIGDPLGATVTRWVTFETYLDDGATPDVDEHFLPQIFVVERKKNQNKIFVEFELSASMDQEGRLLPARQILRDSCSHEYRKFNILTGLFEYERATCPYVGRDEVQGGAEDPFFRTDGTSTADPNEDACGKKLSDCKKRFDAIADGRVPGRFFPSVARTR